MKKCKIIGLTGQSGAGKSTVAKYFEENNINVINADVIVHRLYGCDSACKRAVCAVFGNDIATSDGGIDRKLLAERAFSSKENTKLLGSVVHPFVMAEFLAEVKNSGSEVVVYDAPQLFESNADVICDLVVSVVADEAVRLQRICKRDNISEELAKMRLSVQLGESFFRENSDFIIENNDNIDILKEQILNLVNTL